MHAKSWLLAAALAVISTASATHEERPRIYFPRHVKRQFTNATITSAEPFPSPESSQASLSTTLPITTKRQPDTDAPTTDPLTSPDALVGEPSSGSAVTTVYVETSTIVVAPTPEVVPVIVVGTSGGVPQVVVLPTGSDIVPDVPLPVETPSLSSGILLGPQGIIFPTASPTEVIPVVPTEIDSTTAVSSAPATSDVASESPVASTSADSVVNTTAASSSASPAEETPVSTTANPAEEPTTTVVPAQNVTAPVESPATTPAAEPSPEPTPEPTPEPKNPLDPIIDPIQSVISSVLPPLPLPTPTNITDPAVNITSELPLPIPTSSAPADPTPEPSPTEVQPPPESSAPPRETVTPPPPETVSQPPPETTTPAPETVTTPPPQTTAPPPTPTDPIVLPPVNTTISDILTTPPPEPTPDLPPLLNNTVTEPPAPVTSTPYTIPANSTTPPPTPTQDFTDVDTPTSVITSVAATGTITDGQPWLPTTVITEQGLTASTPTEALAPTTTATLPSYLPKVISPNDPGVSEQPENSVLLQVGLLCPYNYKYVSQTPMAAAQIFSLLPQAMSYASHIDAEQIKVQKLVPLDTNSAIGCFTTLVRFYYPEALVDSLRVNIKVPYSSLYTNPDVLIYNFTQQINPAIDIFPGPEEDDATATGGGAGATSTANPGGDIFSQPVTTQTPKEKVTTAGIAVGSLGVAVACGAAMFLVARRYKRKKQSHQRSSSISDGSRGSSGMRYTGSGSPAFMGGALMSREFSSYGGVAGGRDSHGSGRTQRSGPGNSARSAFISAPMAAENSLGWN